MKFQFGGEQKIKDTVAIIKLMDNDCPARGRKGHVIWVPDQKYAPIPHVD